jgi:azurin
MKLLSLIFSKKHYHEFNKPVMSRYVSFNSRDIIFECKCGELKMVRENRGYADAFSMGTNLYTTAQEMDDFLKSRGK